jgi:hypothetical protein
MIKIDDHTTINLDVIAINHYGSLIAPLLINGIDYHSTQSLIGRIVRQRQIDAVIPDHIRLSFWDYLLNNNYENLRRLIVSRPDVLKTIIAEIEVICGVGFFSNDIDYDRANLTPFGIIVQNVFNYSLYRSKLECINNCDLFNLAFCPYCNEQLIQVITDTNGLTGNTYSLALLQLDHFYPQVRHPYLSVSFFNLIPGCSPCNAQLKLQKRFDIDTHFNPFQKRLDDYFKFKLDNVFLNSEADVVIRYVNKLPYSDNAFRDFRIISRYNNIAYKKVVFRMVNTFSNNSPKVWISRYLQLGGLFNMGDSRKRTLFESQNIPLSRDEINHVQFGKLKRDIAIQLGY